MITTLLTLALLFPSVSGKNLHGQKKNLPADFAGKANAVVLAFQKGSQAQVDTWFPTMKEISAQYPDFRYYELPTITGGYRFMRGIIDGGMKKGVKDSTQRDLTVTLYLDKSDFMDALELENAKTIHVLLLNEADEVVWRCEGVYNPTNAEVLKEEVGKLLGQ